MTLMGIIIFCLFRQGVLGEITAPTIHGPLIVLVISSCIVGTTVTAIISRIPLKPILKVVDAFNQVATGDFTVRLTSSAIDEVNTFCQSFNSMVEELNSVEMLRSDFVNNFSHEFKTPIVSLRGFAKILKSPELTEDERNEYLDIIISESDRLAKLSTNVLTLTKIESLNIIETNDEFDLSEQIRRALLVLEPKWEPKNLELIIDLEEISFFGNEDLLSQVWLNLIDNAIKFSPQNSKLNLKLKKHNSGILFQVMDQGYGMDKDSQKYIFDKFYQCDKSHSTEGNGLGLSIANKIVLLHGGKISIESELGIGTVFSVELPLVSHFKQIK